MRNFSGFKMICSPSVHGNNLWQLCIAGKECEMDWVEPERFCCWGNTLWPARKNVKIHTRSNCHSPSLIPLPDSLCLKFRNSMPVTRGKRNWRNGWRSILIKSESDVKFKDSMRIHYFRAFTYRLLDLSMTFRWYSWTVPNTKKATQQTEKSAVWSSFELYAISIASQTQRCLASSQLKATM